MNKLIVIILILSVFSLIGCKEKLKAENKIDSNQLQHVNVPVTPEELDSNELGIESITQLKDGSYEINIYTINIQAIAGVQFELVPNNIFKINSIYGGRCESSGFMLKSNERGVMLGFSMQGNIIEPSQNMNKKDNILFSLQANLVSEKLEETFSLVPVLAGKKGITLKVDSVPFTWGKK